MGQQLQSSRKPSTTVKVDRAVLASQIEAAHQSAIERTIDLAHAYWKAGELLTQVKDDVGPSHFKAWIEHNLSFSQPTAYRYIAFHGRHKDGLPESSADLTLTDRTGASGVGSEQLGTGGNRLNLPAFVNKFTSGLETFEREFAARPEAAAVTILPLAKWVLVKCQDQLPELMAELRIKLPEK